MNSKNNVTWLILGAIVFGFLYLFLTYKTPYQQACDLEKEIKSEMKDIEKGGIQWIRLDSSSIGKIEKNDLLFIEESFVLVDSANTDSVGVYSPQGLFDFSKQDLIIAKSFLFKKGTFEYEYAKRGILLEETQKIKKVLEDEMEAKKKRGGEK
ncbi:MAG: hypothetical protein LiPW41_4 [Parcubacteria group bacterium LiPW_41]|nr:MAG: hypothetical protein LiPW41_4 [Parcubacteria group bacterium LiPW_41]